MLTLFSKNKKTLKKISKKVKKISKIQELLKEKNFEDLRELGLKLKEEYKEHKNIDLIVSEAAAIIKEITLREYGLNLYDTQIIAGIALDDKIVAEMKTGEGKTFSAMLTSFISFIKGEQLYIATANEYLTKRDAETTSRVLDRLGVKTSHLQPQQSHQDKLDAYSADIIYGTIVMFAFDYLKDNLALNIDHLLQTRRHNILIDEADLALIDQARTPLSITGDKGKEDIELYMLFRQKVDIFENTEEESIYELDLETKNITLLDVGYTVLENFLIENKFINKKEEMYISKNLKYLHILNNTLKAKNVFKLDNDYVINNDEAMIIDPKTGRISEGRRWGNGLHQAIEAKEGLTIQQESNTTASITIQNYLKKFEKVSGMTGTAKTEERELKNVYGLKVVVIPTNKDFVRDDKADIVFMKKAPKIAAIVAKVVEENKKGRPILIGTASVDSSMELADALYKVGIKYSLLNAKNHEKESEIISNAGRLNTVTISTNMAGRGTDIMLGGNREDLVEELKGKGISKEEALKEWQTENKKVNEIGGLLVIGVERNISRRIDDQLKGRSGRQGDNGESQFYLSLEDEIIKNYGLNKVEKIWKALNIKDDEPVQNITIDMNIAAIQKRIEGANEEARKMVLSFDDINEEQRNIIYELRNKILNEDKSLDNFLINFTTPQVAKMVQKFANDSYTEEHWDLKGLENYLEKILAKKIDIYNWFKSDTNLTIDDIIIKVKDEFNKVLAAKKELFKNNYNQAQKETMLKVIDEHWSLQLSSLTELKNRVFFRSYAQEKPLEEYQKEIFKEFKEKINNMEEDFILSVSHMELNEDYKIFIKQFRLGLSPVLTVGI
jgi:preprotein translocase subunit SecA